MQLVPGTYQGTFYLLDDNKQQPGGRPDLQTDQAAGEDVHPEEPGGQLPEVRDPRRQEGLPAAHQQCPEELVSHP